jgi:hypothetical protein
VLGAGGTVEEVPRPEEPLLTLDEQTALAREYEERLLLRLGVVEAIRLTGGDVESDFTTNQPSPAGARPDPESSSRASGTRRV